MTIRVEHADMLAAIPRLVVEGVVVDAVVTDPPYHLSPMHKRFGQASSSLRGRATATAGRRGVIRLARGRRAVYHRLCCGDVESRHIARPRSDGTRLRRG